MKNKPETLDEIITHIFNHFYVPNEKPDNNHYEEAIIRLFRALIDIGREEYGFDAFQNYNYMGKKVEENGCEYLLDITWCRFGYGPALIPKSKADNWPQCLFYDEQSEIGMFFGCEVEMATASYSYKILEDYVKILDTIAPFKLFVCCYPPDKQDRRGKIIDELNLVTRKHHSLIGQLGILIFCEDFSRCHFYQYFDDTFTLISEGMSNLDDKPYSITRVTA